MKTSAGGDVAEDCLLFAVMRELGLTHALTADRHFEQAGYSALLRTAAP